MKRGVEARWKQIPLPPDCISAPSRADVLILEQVMLYPTTRSLEHLPPIKAHAWGFASGIKLRKMVGYANAAPDRAGGGRANQQVAAVMWRSRAISAKTIDNEIWPQYRSVDTLWAAWYHRSLDIGPDIFPCRTAELKAFFEVAEAYRIKAELTKSSVTGPTILQPGESLAVPQGVDPSLQLEFSLRR